MQVQVEGGSSARDPASTWETMEEFQTPEYLRNKPEDAFSRHVSLCNFTFQINKRFLKSISCYTETITACILAANS